MHLGHIFFSSGYYALSLDTLQDLKTILASKRICVQESTNLFVPLPVLAVADVIDITEAQAREAERRYNADTVSLVSEASSLSSTYTTVSRGMTDEDAIRLVVSAQCRGV